MAMRWSAAVLLVVALASGPAAATPDPVDQAALTSGQLRSAAGTGSLGALLAAVTDRLPPRPSPDPVSEPSIQQPLPEAITALLTAVLQAEPPVAAAVAAGDRATVAATVRALNRGELAALHVTDEGVPLVDPRIAATAELVDVASMASAAARLGMAIDAFLAHAPVAAPATGSSMMPCDITDVPGILCVAGTASNEHRDHYRLTVDLGGDDVYAGATAAGGCLADPPSDSSCVAVAIDLGGNDRYAPAGRLPACEALGFGPEAGTCGQGSGVVGVGILVDASGDDTYEARTAVKADDCLGGQFQICGVVTAQGTGRFGVGVLADLHGNDTYTLSTPAPDAADPVGDRSVTVDGQGNGVAGIGVLWDAGGDDTYLVEGPATGYLTAELQMTGWSSYNAQGTSVGGIGAIVEAGGRDVYRVRIRPGDGAEHRTTRSPWGEGAAVLPATAQGVAYGVSGTPNFGGIVTGPGNTVYEVDLVGRFRSQTNAQGVGPGGRIDDAGGDDTYRISTAASAALQRRCAGCDLIVGGPQFPFAGGNVALTTAFGQGVDGGTLHDRGGADDYGIDAVARLHAVAEDGRAVVSRLTRATVAGQAAGGRLLDDAGDDDYHLSAAQDLQVRGRDSSEALAGALSVTGQGNGGPLMDLGGRDVYEATAVADVAAQPGGTVATDAGYQVVVVQGLGAHGSLLHDRDGGQLDVFHADATGLFSVCNGRHGTAPGWTGGQRRTLGATGEESCSSTGGGAAVSSAAPATAPAQLSLDAAPMSGVDAIRFTLRLTDATGAPLAGRRLRVEPELLLGSPYYEVGPTFVWQPWGTGLQVITDVDGLASGAVRSPTCPQIGAPCAPPRLTASFFGDAVADPVTASTAPAATTG